jgi:transposase InsO family protein
MPWESPMNAKEALILDVNDGMSVSEAAEEHGVARSCAYKWVARYRKHGWEGIEDRSRRPERSPFRTPQEKVDELCKLKRKYPAFGPAKLVAMLEELQGEAVMAVSTAGQILARSGMVQRRRKCRPAAGRIEHPPYEVAGAGDTATADYKGQFRMGNRALCYPLTMADPFSRYVTLIAAMTSTEADPARAAFERSFRKYGVPRQIVSDNGGPFCCTRSLGGLTRLSRWWIELGITPVRIEPGRPDQNGIHERMHRTLKEWIHRHPRSNLRSQQRAFDAFRREFNDIRPHQSLGQKPPATAFRSYRPYPSRWAIEYDSTMEVRTVRSNGEIKWNADKIFLSEVLIGAKVGLLPIAESLWAIHFGSVQIGYLDDENQRAVNRRPIDQSE